MAMEVDKQDRCITTVSTINPLDTLVLQKEKEWRDAFQLRIETLEATLREREKELKNERLRFRKLKEDFEYNLRLIEERDKELDKYDATFGKTKQAEHVKAVEISELLVNVDELKLKIENEVQAREELQNHYQKRLKDYQNEMKNFRQEKENELNKEREELTSHRRNLESQLREVEDDFEFRRQELVSNFDEVMRKREHEFRAKLDETSSLLLANDLKVRTLTKELELVRSTSGHCKEDLKNSEMSTRELEKELKEKEWMIVDLQNTHNFKMADMEAKMVNMKSLQSKLQEDFQRKHAELDRLAREREEMLLNTKQGFSEQERKLVDKIRELHTELETTSQEYRQKEWSLTDKLKEQDVAIQRLQESIATLQSTLESQRQESARTTVAKDVELEALQQQEAKLRTEVAQRKEELARRRNELTLSLEREAAHERTRAQLELDWQRRCEDGERIGYEKQEELVKSLTQGKQEAFSLVNQQKRELLHKDSLIRILTAQRDESTATLKRHGLSVPAQIPTKGSAVSMDGRNIPETVQIEDVQIQNENLLQVIHQMRTDMEDLTTQLLQQSDVTKSKAETGAPITPEYVNSLEKEVRDLKAKIRDLPHTSVGKGHEKSTKPSVVVKTADPYIRGHVKELNDTIGCLRQEKLELTSQVRKCEATIVHIQGVLNQCTEEARQKQVTIEQLKYQLTTLSRRTEEEISSWKQRNTDLSLQVTQARQEADEFYKNGLERNVDAVSLGNQLSTLKLDLASQGKAVNFYNPEGHVQVRQLEEEIQSLRKQLNKVMLFDNGVRVIPQQGKTAVLQKKLREAVERINMLVKEREQLIKMGNKMRAELMKMKGADESKKSPQALPQSPPSHLQALEQLQYQLTARELQYAQRGLVRDNALHTTSNGADPVPSPRNPSVSRKPEAGLSENRETSSSRGEKEVSPWQPSFSSDGRSSLQEVWKLLDEDSPGFTPRGLRGDEEVSGPLRSSRPPGSSSAAESFTVRGEASNVQSKRASSSGRRVLSEKAAGRWKPLPAKGKVRNYNIKDNEI